MSEIDPYTPRTALSPARVSSRPVVTLDTRGLRCPLPVRRTRERLQTLPAGALLEVLGDDPLIVIDLPAFCSQEGHSYLGHREESPGVFRLTLRKAG